MPETDSFSSSTSSSSSLSSPRGCYIQSLDSTTTNSSNSTTSIARYKTELCRPFTETGKCKYGEKCQFAHGFQEIRQLTRHPKYKTEYCRTFHTTGYCPYGPRCHFIHDISEARTNDDQVEQKTTTVRRHSEKTTSQPRPYTRTRINSDYASSKTYSNIQIYDNSLPRYRQLSISPNTIRNAQPSSLSFSTENNQRIITSISSSKPVELYQNRDNKKIFEPWFNQQNENVFKYSNCRRTVDMFDTQRVYRTQYV
ncbi:unnamed protein product [Didymodactylos carnosus]|uniref:C3H1-type domain-containing protein n=1 Tax=Didymodactylos carnosus TaxID=1234261 RepID=A0A814KNL8_9BILA|nr:unnamed protein product [Didymodactylos carnosus]CAF1053723.1 unnamed protein product [Didymodactylos carnosus]CAF3688836.1 unnamed protein product [Didymodactylos carnosus]CAF3822964.1 unnamed protein product [Didymodactylos carnosus]